MRKLQNPRTFLLLAGAVALLVALGFAAYTDHLWEDYYITYRSSKNLALGHGLVFNPGDRLHTFTSPLGVLLPAFARLLTFNTSDPVALWIFRVMSAAAFGGAAALLLATARRLAWTPFAGVLLVGWFVTDGKNVDFTINGMETGFLLLFLAYAWWASFTAGARRWCHLGVAWAGLMWTRPDGFVYAGLLGAATWLFNDPARAGLSRRDWLRVFLQAGLLCTALYLPWLLWAWSYYGTPIPHTITAKGAGLGRGLGGGVLTFLRLPYSLWIQPTSLEGAFLPSYFMLGGWPETVRVGGRVAAFVASVLWLVPGVSRPVRAASLVFHGAHAYLSYFPNFPFPWYLPAASLFGGCALVGAFADCAGWLARRGARTAVLAGSVGAAALLAGPLWLFVATARQAEAQQRVVETGHRRAIGRWLRENSRPGDTVFLEPLGYIGFFSRLKTYDYPGMSSREMVRARAEVGEDWHRLIQRLKPTWLVLRPGEAERVAAAWPGGLTETYVPVRTFDVGDAVRALDVRGRPYLEFDARFTVYRRAWARVAFAELVEKRSDVFVAETTLFDRPMVFAHADSRLVVRVPAGSARCRIGFAFQPDAYAGDPPTDGAVFDVEWVDGERRQTLLHERLDPVARVADRQLRMHEIELPAGGGTGAVLVLSVVRAGHAVRDLTCWTLPEFKEP